MRKLNDTITRLAALKARPLPSRSQSGDDRLTDLSRFGSNPGALRGLCHVPVGLEAKTPLVVALHGCTQTAADYAFGSGWVELADRHRFAVLLPEQRPRNNPNLCFNWFNPADTQRGSGEALSIRQMVARMLAVYDLDPDRVFVTGLSAGGAMTAAMLATYPDVFAGGAVIAGLPYGTASSVPEAFDRMRGHGGPKADALPALVKAASDHEGPWPILSVWHGHRDQTVDAVNAFQLVEQFRALHKAKAEPDVSETVDGAVRRAWRGQDGRIAIEDYRLPGLGHGTPLATRGADGLGETGPFMLEAGISSTRHIARFWGLLREDAAARGQTRESFVGAAPSFAPETAPAANATRGVGEVIEDALRAAGLMR